MALSKKAIYAHLLRRMLDVSYPTRRFAEHRTREVMWAGNPALFGAGGRTVEVDETFIGHDRAIKPKGEKKGRGYANKGKVPTLIDRTTGCAKSMMADTPKALMPFPILKENVAQGAAVYTGETDRYRCLGHEFADCGFIRHASGDNGRGEVLSNTAEGCSSIFKWSTKGVYQHYSKKHLHRSAAEFKFRFAHRLATGFDYEARYMAALSGIWGEQLSHQDSSLPK